MKKYLIKSKKLFIINVLFVIIDSSLYTFIAFLIKDLIDTSINKNMERFTNIALISIFFIIILLISSYLREIFFAKYIQYNMTVLRYDIFSKIINRNKENFHGKNTSHYISLINNDLELIQRGYFLNFLNIIQAILSFFIATLGLLKLNTIIAVFILIISTIPIIVPYIFNNKLSTLKKSFSDSLSSLMKITKDFLLGFETIKSFNLQNTILCKYNKHNSNMEQSRYNFFSLNAMVNLIINLFSYLSYFIVLGIGTYLVIKDKTTVGTFVATIQLMEFISGPITNISYIIADFKSMLLIGNKIIKVVDENTLEDLGLKKNSFVNSIEFKNISFSYNQQNLALKNISFKIVKGQKVAIVGKSGCGKSTLINLLLKYYDNYTGDIFIDNINIKNINSESIHNLISVIHQDVFMFDTSFKNNLTLFKNYSEQDINKVINVCKLYGLVNNLQNGINSNIGENGYAISGGEKQRISIARALIRKSPILILDEATNSLDNKTSYLIENSLLNISDLTLISITHKFSKQLLEKYDLIIVLKDSNIVEIGPFNKLMNNKNYFYELYSLTESKKPANINTS
ncbi:ABC transporter ATP-binding protein [Anaerosalibacter massiliensis]|uniref:ABC transporter ATP-binding protein n=1 Tax=Anaerosalibacter massiliensis TaxID=1347392 RepID=UPI0006787DA3|nr:ABC transporter ATP-binding protein [Anaerosalibacter massiliensis]